MWISLSTERAETLAGKHGTPLYVFDLKVLRARVELMRALGTKVLYAVKANPHAEVLRALEGLVDGFDLASEGELHAVERVLAPLERDGEAPSRSASGAGAIAEIGERVRSVAGPGSSPAAGERSRALSVADPALSPGAGERSPVLSVASASSSAAARERSRVLSVAGPAKSEALLARAVELDAVINLESVRELELVRREARRLARPARVRLRVNSTTAFRAYRLQMTGAPSPFGFDEETLDEVLPLITAAVRAREVELEGVHLHPGSQGTSAGGFLAVLSTGLALLERVRTQTSLEAPSLNLGGGFGAIAPGDELDVAALAERVADQRARFTRAVGPVSLWVEPGRWLAGPAGLYVTRVVSEKRSRGVHFTVLDGGVHQHFAHAALLLPPKASRAPVLNLTRPDAPRVTRTLVGALCTPLDTFGEVSLPEPRVGELLAFQGAGAYGLSFSPFAFLSHRVPAEVFL